MKNTLTDNVYFKVITLPLLFALALIVLWFALALTGSAVTPYLLIWGWCILIAVSIHAEVLKRMLTDE